MNVDTEQIVGQSSQLAARDVAIDGPASLERAVEFRRDVGNMIARVRQFFAPLKASAHKAHRDICDKENEVLAPLLSRDVEVTAAIRDFKARADVERREQERQEQARQQLQREADAAAEAADAEAAGDVAAAAGILDDAISAPPPIVVLPDITRQVDGLKFRRRWLWRYAPDGERLVPIEFRCIDERKISAFVRSMKDSGKIPGVEIYYVDDPIR